ncbi:hypothetical protein [Deinococcus sp.]|uniref:hypothetical protein n=1 Tax=Deinococcus sp. TaxID=47478 RepID=UPI003CC58FBD
MNEKSLLKAFEPFCYWQAYDATYRAKYRRDDGQAGLFVLLLNGELVYSGKFMNGLKSRVRVLRKKKDSDKGPYRQINREIKLALASGQVTEMLVLPLLHATPAELTSRLKEVRKAVPPIWKS